MCGIAAFQLAPGSKINARALAHALLSQIEWRGTDASGFAYATRDGRTGIYKDHVIGSQLKLKGMPKDADTVILHTRMATHGSHMDNDNNHPVSGPEDRIRLVHNGVLYNHDDVRQILARGNELPAVDTSVLPAVLEEFGIEGSGIISGYAAAAWLDTQTSNTLHIARFDGSPVTVARLLDGSFVMASTDALLAGALKSLQLQWIGSFPDPFESMKDGQYITVVDSVVSKQANVEWYDDYTYTGRNWGNTTSGGHGVSTVATRSITGGSAWRGLSAANAGYGSSAATPVSAATNGSESLQSARDAWEREDTPGAFDQDGVWSDSAYHSATPFALTRGAALSDMFYLIDHEGDYQGFDSLNAMLQEMVWAADLTSENNFTPEGDERWVNHFSDLGEVLDDGELQSWIDNPSLVDDFESIYPSGLAFVRHGIGTLKGVMA